MIKQDTYLSVIVPVYNEEDRIPKTLRSISDYLEKQPYSYEIIVVNDGSRDNTSAVVLDICHQIPNCLFIDRKRNKGKGYSVREGILTANGKIRLFTDADSSTDISHFEKMRGFFDKGYEVVIGSRESKDAMGARQAISQQWHKRLFENIINLFVRAFVVRGIRDTQAGFKAFRDYAAQEIFSRAKIDRWAFDVEALALAKHFGYQIGVISLNWVNDPSSRVCCFGYFKVLLDTIKIKWNLARKKYI